MDALVPTPARRKPATLACTILAIAAATIAGAFAFQAAGYPPCDLCLKERLPYYAAIIVAAATIPAAGRGGRGMAMACFGALALIFAFGAGLGAYHAGVEWGLWAGPTDCTGPLGRAQSNADFLQQLRTVRVVRCDAAALRVLGLSLAGWSVVVSLAAAAVALVGFNALRLSHRVSSLGR